jgi:hypothetical protein
MVTSGHSDRYVVEGKDHEGVPFGQVALGEADDLHFRTSPASTSAAGFTIAFSSCWNVMPLFPFRILDWIHEYARVVACVNIHVFCIGLIAYSLCKTFTQTSDSRVYAAFGRFHLRRYTCAHPF